MFQGDYIWIEPVSGREFDVAIGARVISAEGRRIQVKDDDGKVGIPPYCIEDCEITYHYSKFPIIYTYIMKICFFIC